jgi:hypothetical protein
MRITQRVMLVIAAAFIVLGGVLSTRHVFDAGYDCGTAFAQHETTNGLTEATVFGAPPGSTFDCGTPIRNQRGLAGGAALIGVLIAAAAVLSAVHIGSRPNPEREVLRLNG